MPGTRLPPVVHWLPALREPERALRWDLPTWEHVVRLGRRLRLLARLAESLDTAGQLDAVPESAARHLRAELRLSRWRTTTLRWTIDRVASALGDAAYPRVLLKGAAYVGQELAIAKGRISADLDILVPRANVADAQGRLALAGWRELELDAHDRRYYHEWSHEVPPMHHSELGMELDLHHNILPPVAHTRVDADQLLQRLQPCQWTDWQVLHPIDQVIHSAAHLFLDSEMRDRVRDLVDLDGLMRQFGSDPGFWTGLPARARELGLGEPLALAVHFSVNWLQTPVPEATRRQVEAMGSGRWQRQALQGLLRTVLTPSSPDEAPGPAQGAAATLLLARYHYRRMPLSLLVPHLWHKARKASRAPSPGEQARDQG